MTKDKCYHVECISNELCIPIKLDNLDSTDDVSMVLVQPTLGDESWEEVLVQQGNIHTEKYIYLKYVFVINKSLFVFTRIFR